MIVTAALLTAGIDPAAAAPPAPQRLASTITQVAQPPAPSVVVAPRAAGASVVERFAAPRNGVLPAGQPLVAILRAGAVDLGDTVNVVRAERVGATIYVEVEERICLCGRTITNPTVPYVEVALGALPAGSYTLALRETQLTFSEEQHPETASHPRRVLELQGMPLTVR